MAALAVVGAEPPEALRRSGHELTSVAPESAPSLDVRVSPANLEASYRLYRFLEGERFDAVVFDDVGAHGYCCARAKQLGLAFAETRILSRWQGPLQWRAEREGRAYLTKGEVRQAVCERLQVELADAVIAGSEAFDWMRRQGWELPGVAYADDADGWEGALSVSGVHSRSAFDQPPVTVVIPHFERPELLPHCLEGLAKQTYPNLEVIVADDGSASDAARQGLARIEARSWPWPLRILSLTNAGVDSARNAGWRAARHDLVVFIDDDDVPFDRLVETLVRTRATAGADVVAAGIRTFPHTGEPQPRAGDVVGIFLGRPYEFGLIGNQYGGPVCIWPKQLLEQLGGFRLAAVLQEDGEILARATLAGASVVAVPRPLYWNRLTPDGRYGEGRSAMKEAWPAVVGRLHADRLPADYKLAPLLAGGAYVAIDRLQHELPARAPAALQRVRRALARLRRTPRARSSY